MADRREIFAVCAGGFIGALARAVLSDQVTHARGAWPWATFSTLQLEVLQMLDEHAYPLAAAYVLVSVTLGLVCVAAAAALARRRPVG